MAATVSASKRWTHFHSALQLAIQRSGHKWTYEDFAECFSLWCEEEPDSSSSVCSTIANHLESSISKGCEDLLAKMEVKPNVDRLHAVIMDARARKKAGYTGKDIWREELLPSAAARARIIPTLKSERDRLKAQLEELDQRNRILQAEMQANVKIKEEADNESYRLLDTLDAALSQWDDVPIEDIQSWTLQTAESINSSSL
ncbi:hypothetical protein BDW22DRAFT_1419756 [Trametopsis cervina]|nr:hypothetical protein BDW22DRAFT_1419756 [Trametopsis cervina]